MFSDVDDNAPMILDVPFGRIDGVRQQPRTRYGGGVLHGKAQTYRLPIASVSGLYQRGDAMQRQSQSGRYVLVDSGIGHLMGIRESANLSGIVLRTVRSVTEALGSCLTGELPDLVLVGVRDANVDAISRCHDVLRQRDAPIIAFGPEQEPALRVRCFRAGAVDYIDASASARELDLRIGMHIKNRWQIADVAASREIREITGSRKQEICQLAVKYLSQTEIGNISQQLLASRIGVSVGHLDAAFRSVMGYSVVRFLRRRRMDIARMLLEESLMSVTAIAELLGFCDGANFATAFRQETGKTPSEYRFGRSGARQSGNVATATSRKSVAGTSQWRGGEREGAAP
ncbi:hypothetical protein AL486_17860 [Pandoraea apista]|uniref:helix-turn-helix domain-containing protein n=1 Tax=Pandoraea apista TaxID=93218 RepID=UPI000CE96898|nr:helix-turn-helix domain-containing protein [Pandoraea apista]AVF41349.1 hypothetical protein AL486_17860 [Pandoraea apista]